MTRLFSYESTVKEAMLQQRQLFQEWYDKAKSIMSSPPSGKTGELLAQVCGVFLNAS